MDLVSGRKMLLADDSITIQKVVDLTFADEGMEVTTVSNGEQAIQQLEEIAPDIVLADVFMPGRNGYEVCEHIKRDERFRHIPVMLLVGSFEPFDEAEARRVGADDFLTKPFQSIRQLVSKVGALLSGREDEATTQDLKLPVEAARAADTAGSARPTELSMADTAPLQRDMLDTIEPDADEQEMTGHASFDDQMIEAAPASSFSSSSSAGSSSEVDRQMRPTAPLHSEEFQEMKIDSAELETSPSHLQETIQNFNFEEFDPAPSPRQPTPTPQTPAPYMDQAAAADEALLDLGDIEAPGAAAEADDFILDLQDEAPIQQTAPQPSPPPSEMISPLADDPGAATLIDYQGEMIEAAPQAEESSAGAQATVEEQRAETVHVEEFALVEGAEPQLSEQQLSEAQLFEPQVSEPQGFDPHATLPEIQEAPVDAPVESPQAESMPAAAPTVADDREEAVETGSTAAAAAATGVSQITLDQLSPEVIDAIARRAVEQLSERVIQEIAWEVVPQLAELLIKQRLEEEKKQ